MKNTEKDSNVLRLFAFIALIIVAILQVFSVLSKFGILSVTGFLPNFLDTVKNICICIVIGFVSYGFVKNKSKGFRITFWVSLAIIIVGTILIWFVKQ